MARKRKTDGDGCEQLEQLYKDGDVVIEELAHTSIDAKKKSSSLHLAKIASSLGKSPCDYLKTKHSTCRLIAGSVPDENGKLWDFYLMNCHYGPPCDFFEKMNR
jgi:hypothetical protein